MSIKHGFKPRRLTLLACLSLLLLPTMPSEAQTDENVCPALVNTALTSLDTVCAETGRNEACYGHFRVDALLRDEAATFDEPADVVSIEALEEVRTYGMDVENEVWGVALLRVQADIPDSLPGQNVTFLLFGDVTMTNAGSETQPAIPEACQVLTFGGTNLRSGPGGSHNLVGSVPGDTALPATGRNAAGDWLRVMSEFGEAWVFNELVDDSDCDAQALPVVEAGAARVYGPMQAFYLETGLSEPACAEAPPNVLVARSPEGVSVALNVNGVEILMGSTIEITAVRGGDMTIGVLAGQITATADGVSRTAPEGFTITVPLDETLQASGPPSFLQSLESEALAPLDSPPATVFEDDVALTVPEPGDPSIFAPAAGNIAAGSWTDTETAVEITAGGAGCAIGWVSETMTVTLTITPSADGSSITLDGAILTRVGDSTYQGSVTSGPVTCAVTYTFTSATTTTGEWICTNPCGGTRHSWDTATAD